jgi:hypothetical protein
MLSDSATTPSLIFGSAVTSPTSNPTLCNSNCAALSTTFSPSSTFGTSNVRAVQFFAPNQNLHGATISASIAVDNPAGIAAQVQLFAGGDSSTNWAWSNAAKLLGSALAPYDAANGFHDVSIAVTDNGRFCAASAFYLAVWLDIAAVPSTTGKVTVYIKSISVTPPGSGGGTGGAPGTGGTPGAAGSPGSAGAKQLAGSGP